MSPKKSVLILGASGQLGSAIVSALNHASHLNLVQASHRQIPGYLFVEYNTFTTASAWEKFLTEHNINAVVNCVGIWTGEEAQFELIQYIVPTALMDACEILDLQLIHVSALGFKLVPDFPYMTTKVRADQHLLTKSNKVTSLKPSLVYGPQGGSSKFFKEVALLPVNVDYGFEDNIQPVHEKDVGLAVLGLLEQDNPPREFICAGPYPLSPSKYLDFLRQGMGAGVAPVRIRLPKLVGKLIFKTGQLLGRNFVNDQTWRLLEIGSKSDQLHPQATPYSSFTSNSELLPLKLNQLYWAARISNAVLWIGTAIGTWFFWPHSQTVAWLEAFHPAFGHTLILLFSCVFDALMGICSLVRPHRNLWRFQFLVTLFYTVALVVFLPWTLAHPFGPLLKNLAVFVMLAYLAAMETDRHA